jgi:hypothetical protein
MRLLVVFLLINAYKYHRHSPLPILHSSMHVLSACRLDFLHRYRSRDSAQPLGKLHFVHSSLFLSLLCLALSALLCFALLCVNASPSWLARPTCSDDHHVHASH